MEEFEFIDLRSRKVRVTVNGKTKEFASLTEASKFYRLNYLSMWRWAHGMGKPRIGIKVEYVDLPEDKYPEELD